MNDKNDLILLLTDPNGNNFQKKLNKNSWNALIFAAGALFYALAIWLPTIVFNPALQ